MKKITRFRFFANDNEWTPDNPTGHDKWDEENQTWYS